MTGKKLSITIGVALIVIGGVGLAIWAINEHGKKSTGHGGSDKSLVNQNVLDQLPKQQASTASLDRVSTPTPPTNSWISGLALQSDPKAVFPLPYSFKALVNEFQIGLPTVKATATEIIGGHTPDINVKPDGATNFTLSRFDKTSATITYRSNNEDIGKVTIAQGSPYVFYRASNESTLKVRLGSDIQRDGSTTRFKIGNKQYAVHVTGGAKIDANSADAIITVPKNGLVTWYAVPEGSTDLLRKFAGNEIKQVSLDYEIEGDKAETSFTYETENSQPTLVAFLPYQTIETGQERNLKYRSTYGDMSVHQGNTFVSSAPVVEAKQELDISKLSEDEKDKVISDLRKDSADSSIAENDTYFAGKRLARLATLLSLAEQLGVDDVANTLKQTLREELTKRLGSDYLYYDTELKGIAGKTSGFGSEDFNDHHFHYGYFIYAASVLAKYDSSFADEYSDEVNLLVADIASYEDYDYFPLMRHYDPYSGHSWAAGIAPFDDGNNQESSSEALNAWNAVALWSDVIGNKSLKQAATWMLANETQTATKAWRSVDTSYSYLAPYTAPVASLNFGGKRTYSTFFSNESNTKLAIQLIPMSPVMQVFAEDGGDIAAKLSKQDKPDDFNVALGDYLIMYQALTDKSKAMTALERQRDEFIDNGNARSYIRAWIYTQE